MEQIELKSFAKINLTLDIKGMLDNGFHQVEMVMQQILLCDDVFVRFLQEDASSREKESIGVGSRSGVNSIRLTTNRKYLPVDERNLAYKAVLILREYCRETGRKVPDGTISIHIKKRIPVAAGLAGGSGNGAAVLHALNVLWELGLDVKTLCEISKKLGSDVPFCVMGQAAANQTLQRRFRDDSLACHCALATGTGTELKPVKGLKSHLVLSKPPISVSTGAVYQGMDQMENYEHPDAKAMMQALRDGNRQAVVKNMGNVLENYTLKEYPIVVYTKNKMGKLCNPGAVLMSGSGPTVFGLCQSREHSQIVCEEMKKINKESYWTRTTC